MSDLKNEALKLGLQLARGSKADMQKEFTSLYNSINPAVSLEDAKFEVEVLFNPDTPGNGSSDSVKGKVPQGVSGGKGLDSTKDGSGDKQEKSNRSTKSSHKSKKKGKHKKKHRSPSSSSSSESSSSDEDNSHRSHRSHHGAFQLGSFKNSMGSIMNGPVDFHKPTHGTSFVNGPDRHDSHQPPNHFHRGPIYHGSFYEQYNRYPHPQPRDPRHVHWQDGYPNQHVDP